jgi:hypothetical protein
MDNDRSRSPQSLSEAQAQRLLARAAELDAQLGAPVPLERLRLAAHEAGLSAAAFDAALAELRAAGPDPVRESNNTWPRIARYAAALVGAGTLVVGGAMILNDSNADWLVRKLFDPLALGLGAALAMRFRARPFAMVLGGLAVATGAEFLMDMRAGEPAIRGAAPHFALLIAGIGGVLLGAFLRRPPRDEDSLGAPVAESARESAAVRPSDATLLLSAA